MPKFFYKFCQRYIKKYEGFSYDFERNGERLLLERLKAFDIGTVFDVGVNVGEWTGIALENFASAKVHAFEISKSTFAELAKAHSSDARVTLNNFGLSDRDATVQYKDYGATAGGNTILTEADYHDARITPDLLETQVTTGDSYCAANSIPRIDFLKIDVEGAEHLVLHGFRRMLGEGNIRLVQFEYGYISGDAHFLMKDYFRFFAEHGYDVGVLKPRGAIFTEFHYRLNDFNSGPNFVALAKSDTALRDAIRAPR